MNTTTKKLIEVYRNMQIWDIDGAIAVNKPEDGQEHLFFVALDDSKLSGNKQFNEQYNTVEVARNYIKWLEIPKTKTA